MPQYNRLDETKAFPRLAALKVPSIDTLLTAERVAVCDIPMGADLVYNWAAAPVDENVFALLSDLAKEQELIEKFKLLADGEIMNTGEHRMVLHHLARGMLGKSVVLGGKDLRRFYEGEREKAAEFARDVHTGKIVGSTGKPFSTAVQIGIGGSDLGPRALYIALRNWAKAEGRTKMEARFISNVDPEDCEHALAGLDLSRCLFVVVSKSGTTQETLVNERLAREALKSAGLDPAKHIVAVTSETSPLAKNPGYLRSFYIDDFIGGRFSSSSAVGCVILSLAFGPEVFAEFLSGAHDADKRAMEKDISHNATLLDAMIGLYERNVLKMGQTAVLPYSEALSRFPAHLQQLDMESNGKRVDREGRPLSYSTGPIIFGEPGTNGQHSFYQLLHQGTDPVPLQFIGFVRGQTGYDLELDGSTSRQKLNANLAAQIVALARGKQDTNTNKAFLGKRPSTLIRGEKLTPRALGALLAHFENKVMFQGFAWNINSFDQEGVQLGKVLSSQVLSGARGDPTLAAYARKLGLKTAE
jgi:glucose-6-phosphate isomerase